MITVKQADDLMDGCALLECLGNLFEYIGSEDGNLIFQAVSDDHYIIVSYENLIGMPEYSIQY